MINLTRPYTDQRMKKDFLDIIKAYDFDCDIYINKFIKKFLKLYNLKYGFCYNSCNSALIVSLSALGIKEGDSVIIPAYTCKAIVDVLVLLKIKPVLVDNYLDYKHSDFNLDEEALTKNINNKVKAIILPYMFGKVHHYKKIYTLGIPIIEDVTLSLGAPIIHSSREKRILISSFHSSKVISSVEGGILATNDKKIYQELLKVSDIISVNKQERLQDAKKIVYKNSYSFRPSELNFIWGYLQFNRLHNFIRERQRIAKKYIKNLDKKKYLVPIYDKENIYFRFIIGLKKGNAEEILKYFFTRGIEAGRGVYPPLNAYGFSEARLDNANKAALQSISVPLYPSLSDKDINHIINSFNTYAE